MTVTEDNAGAGHLGTVEYNLHRTPLCHSVMELAGQLGAEQAAETVRAFGEAFLFSMPTGKQNTFAKPHSAGCGICDPAGGSAGEPVRRI